jgi:hypothetical protein
MKNYAKVGKRIGRPAFRTPATFRYRAYLKVAGAKLGKNKNRPSFDTKQN